VSHHSPAGAAGLLLSTVPAADIDRQRRPLGAQQQQPRRSNLFSRRPRRSLELHSFISPQNGSKNQW